MPVWHASLSIQHPETGPLHQPRVLEALAIAQLAEVGGSREWWYYNPAPRVGHLRIGVTADEYALIPPGMAVDDAGETGPERRRR